MIERLRGLHLDSDTHEALEALIDNPPVLESKATIEGDGRRIPMIFVRLRDRSGEAQPGLEIRLLDGPGGDVLDASRTDESGLVLLRAPTDRPASWRGWIDVVGTTVGQQLAFGPRKATIVDLEVARPDSKAGSTGTARAALRGVPTDDVIPRLPPIFDVSVCDALTVVLPTRPHPILGLIPGVNPADFRSKTTPVVHRLSERRIGPAATPGIGSSTHGNTGRAAVNRYVVRMRQEWRLLGYTLGELVNVDALDPGALVREVQGETQAATEQAQTVTHDVLTGIVSDLNQTLTDIRHLGNVVRQTMDYEVKQIAAGIPATPATTVSTTTGGGFNTGTAVVGGLLGFLVGGPAGAVAGAVGGGFLGASPTTASVVVPGIPGVAAVSQVVPKTLETVTTYDPTVEITNTLHTAVQQVNNATNRITATVQSLERQLGRTAEHISPLLQRVTNILRWRMYENYLVCTHIEDVLQLHYLQLPGCEDGDLFSAEDIVEYRPFFAPSLLNPYLAPYYDDLAQRVYARDSLFTAVGVEVTYRAPQVVRATVPTIFGTTTIERPLPPARLHVSIGDTAFSIPVPGGQGTVGGTFAIAPLSLDRQVPLRLTLDATEAALAVAGSPFAAAAAPLEFAIDRVRVWFEKSSSLPPDGDITTPLTVTVGSPQQTIEPLIRTPKREGEAISNPLVVHVNRNCRYYLGLLLQTALALPNLRDDAPQLANNSLFNSDSPIWHMPILGVEGDKLVFLRNADPADPNVVQWMADPGSATLVQLQAPGAYAEALQGLLELVDVLKYLHPALKQDLPPVVAPLAVTDLTKLVSTPPVP